MATVTQQLLDSSSVDGSVVLVLRSGATIEGMVERVELNDAVVVVGGWTIRIDEIAGVRARKPKTDHRRSASSTPSTPASDSSCST